MDPLSLAAIFAGGGLLKSALVDAPKEQRQRELAAATQRYSPWTGLKAQPIQYADPFGQALQFGATGASMGAGLKSMDAQNNLTNALANRMNAGGSLGGYGPDFAGVSQMMQKRSPYYSLGVDYSGLNPNS